MDTHAKEKPFKCNICDTAFQSQITLTKHIQRVHEKQQDFGCDQCGKKFFEKHDLNRHLKVHEKASLVPPCDVCGKHFPNMHQRKRHKCKGPEGKYPCEMCEEKLENKMKWGAHMWGHTKDSKYLFLSDGDDSPKASNNKD